MIRQIDHLVIISQDLDTAVANARRAGFHVVPGGTHGDGRTHNALIGFRDGSYIELIAPTSEEASRGDHRWFPRLRQGGGLVDFCLLGDRLDQEIAAIRGRGVEYPEPEPMSRLRPDGVRLEWNLGQPRGEVGETGWPFLIEDITPRELRVPHGEGETRHPNGAVGVAGLTVLVRNLEASRRDFEAILGAAGWESNATFPDDRSGVLLPIGEGGSPWIMLVEPSTGGARDHLETHGQGPYRAMLWTGEGAVELVQLPSGSWAIRRVPGIVLDPSRTPEGLGAGTPPGIPDVPSRGMAPEPARGEDERLHCDRLDSSRTSRS